MDSLDAADLSSPTAVRRPRRWRLPGAEALWLGAALVALPFFTSDFVAYQIALFLVYGIATQGVALCWGRLGFLPAQQWSAVTGGFNGMADIPELPGIERYSGFYWVVAACAVASTALLGVVLRRPLGLLWSAVAQNEDRLQLFGYATDRIKAFAYAFSALLAAVAGALFALHQGI